MSSQEVAPNLKTVSFDQFWTWMQTHPNCIVRAGTSDSVIYDHEEFHWQFGTDGERVYAQVLRGKKVVGEILVNQSEIAFVQCQPAEQEEYFFDLCNEQQQVIYYFVLCHDFDENEPIGPSHWN